MTISTPQASSNNKIVFKQILTHLEVSYDFYDKVLLKNRCRDLIKAMTYDDKQKEIFRKFVKGLNDEKCENDLESLFRMIDAALYHKKISDATTVKWREMGQDDIFNMIVKY